MDFMNNSCRDFVKVLASKEPVPGGGGASALVGAVGAALGNMVGSLTVGKKKYAAVEARIKELQKEADAAQAALLDLVHKDAEAFEPLSKAYGLPKDTPEQPAEKDRVMAGALKTACGVPLEIMRQAAKGVDLCAEFAEKGSRLALSDAGVGAAFCGAAIRGASLNVFINTKSMKDRAAADKFNAEANDLINKAAKKADEVFAKVKEQLTA
jgi:formiminotetrahydrofolate cyclodeaminase